MRASTAGSIRSITGLGYTPMNTMAATNGAISSISRQPRSAISALAPDAGPWNTRW